jgi:hypothetical protein
VRLLPQQAAFALLGRSLKKFVLTTQKNARAFFFKRKATGAS